MRSMLSLASVPCTDTWGFVHGSFVRILIVRVATAAPTGGSPSAE